MDLHLHFTCNDSNDYSPSPILIVGGTLIRLIDDRMQNLQQTSLKLYLDMIVVMDSGGSRKNV